MLFRDDQKLGQKKQKTIHNQHPNGWQQLRTGRTTMVPFYASNNPNVVRCYSVGYWPGQPKFIGLKIFIFAPLE
jgi:hypothetical protein